MPYTSMSRQDRNRFGLKSHVIPMIIAIAYLVDSIEAEITMLRLFTLILAACYVVSVMVAVVQELHERHKARAASGANTSDR
ncbi:MAG: hypothetical protein ACI4L8_00355 [Candidatus Fimadaptatus sp.]